MPFTVGQLAGDYEVLDVLGKGGMGRVYRVRNVISDRIEAMKVLLEDLNAEPGIGDRFIAEIRTLARLDHPNIAKLHTAFKVQNQLVMVMEFVEGVDLSERAKAGSIPLYKVLGYMRQVLAALGYAHNHGVVHRDIKPSNIMVTPQGSVKLMDFGIAKSNAEPLLTTPGTTLGSLLYMPPEQVRGTPVDARSDIYSVGVVLYELTAGRCPFDAESTYHIMDAQLNTPPPPPIEVNPSLPKALNDIILTALQKDPAQRFRSAEAFQRALDSVAAADPAGETRLISDAEAIAPGFAAAAVASQSGPPPSGMQNPRPPLGGAAAPLSSVPFASQPAAPATFAPARKEPGSRKVGLLIAAVACLCILAVAVWAVPHFRKPVQSSTEGQMAFNQSGNDNTNPNRPAPASAVDASSGSPAASDTGKFSTGTAQPSPFAGFPGDSGSKKSMKTSPQRASARQVPPSPAAEAAPTPPPQAAPAPPPGPSQEELNTASEALMKLQARAEAVNQSLNTMKQQQAAQGVGMRGDIVAAQSRMNSYLGAAQRAIENRDLAFAQKNMDHGDEELGKLETFLGR